MSEYQNNLDKLYEKFTEYLQCQMHLHFRGARDVCTETKPLLEIMKKNGMIWKDVAEYLKDKSEIPDYNWETNDFFASVKKYLEKGE